MIKHLLTLMCDFDADILDIVEKGLGGIIRGANLVFIIEKNTVFVSDFLDRFMLPLIQRFVKFIDNFMDKSLSILPEVAYVVKKPFT